MAKKAEPAERAYSKAQILQSKRYQQKDVLSALLKDGQQYTLEEVSRVLNEFLAKEAK
ncbi:hypothetical protein [Desulfitobacterium hafniense]|uniref:hypothetical protein n=1 Tax=Desulfitobacterium hafniense TaxID=49338 RepID=UPI00037C2967|nr:hypothetical protein [Desulfitobacterium hafniense]